MTKPAEAAPASGRGARQRVALAVALGVLAVVVGVVIVAGSSGGGGEDEEIAEAPAECVAAWNDDETALGIGAHAAALHGYTQAWVVFIGGDGRPDADGSCAIVFPAPTPDPEPEFGATILVGERWEPLSERPGIGVAQVGELQREALESANANLFPNGSVHSR
jgi:hypothetical protein